MSTTPRTDEIHNDREGTTAAYWQLLPLARELERENAKLKDENVRLYGFVEETAYGEIGFEKAEVIGNREAAQRLIKEIRG